MYLLLIVGCFALMLALLGWCDRIVAGGTRPPPAPTRTTTTRAVTVDGGAVER